MTPSAPELAEALVQRIEYEAETNIGVETYESLLLELLTILASTPDERGRHITLLLPLVKDWPWGAVETLEFTMRQLRWPEIKEALEVSAVSDPNFRHRDLAKRALAVFEDEWEDGEIYTYYREN